MPQSNLMVQQTGPSPVGMPVYFASGPLAGRVIRGELDELQKADFGRKCGISDRRPLDPPPVVSLKLTEVSHIGKPHEAEHEITTSELVAYGFICFVDMFPLPSGAQGSEAPPGGDQIPSITPRAPSGSSHATTRDLSLSNESGSSMNDMAGGSASSLMVHSPGAVHLLALYPDVSDSSVEPLSTSNPQPSSGKSARPTQHLPPHVAAYVNGIGIVEASCQSHAFVGATVVPMSFFGHPGLPGLLGIFGTSPVLQDLAVNVTGTFVLRYRVANIFSTTFDGNARPVLAECWGGPFVVHTASSFPGLQESTDLTKLLSRLGVPVHVRQNERKRRRGDHRALDDAQS